MGYGLIRHSSITLPIVKLSKIVKQTVKYFVQSMEKYARIIFMIPIIVRVSFYYSSIGEKLKHICSFEELVSRMLLMTEIGIIEYYNGLIN